MFSVNVLLSSVLVANVTDRNGSLETNEPSSPEESNNSDSVNIQSPRHTNLFDFNEFFRLENLPGLQVSQRWLCVDDYHLKIIWKRIKYLWLSYFETAHQSKPFQLTRIWNLFHFQEGASPSKDFTGLQSRFSKWFSNSSRDNSRRSSINEDFGYLNGMY